jgi:Tyrosine phosphatase family
MTDAPTHEPFEPNSAWVPLRAGWITAAGGPSRQRLADWPARGATDVLTLQRADEMQPWIPELCQTHGLGWIHLPLSGRRMEQAGDRDGLARLPGLLDVWSEPRRVVVHCSAGLHRTGAICYLLLRLAGQTRDEAVATIRTARALTAEELVRGARSGVLIDRMDALLATLR